MRNTQVFLSLPSVELSQKHVLAVCIPAPFFCMMTQVTNRTREDNKIKNIYFCGFSNAKHWEIPLL